MSLIIEPITIKGEPVAFETLLSEAFDIHGSIRGCVMNAMEKGGYVAGGFARKILRVGKFKDPAYGIKGYLGWDLSGPSDWAGDIDIFFPTTNAYFTAELSNVWKATMRTPYFDTFRPNKDAVSIQYIKGKTAPIAEMLNTFDIINAKVAFDRHHVYYDDRCLDLERQNVLQVDHVTRIKTMLRICRWRVRHNLPTLHPETREIFNTELNNLMSHCSDVNETIGNDEDDDPITIRQLYDRVSKHRPLIDNETLMSMWLLVGNLIGKQNYASAQDYVSWAEGELNKRAGHVHRAKGELKF